MTALDVALAFGFLGGLIVALGLGALAYWLAQQLGHFRDRSAAAADERAYVLERVETGIATAARATLAAESTRWTLDRMRREADDATDSRVATDRHARIARLRRARARAGWTA